MDMLSVRRLSDIQLQEKFVELLDTQHWSYVEIWVGEQCLETIIVKIAMKP